MQQQPEPNTESNAITNGVTNGESVAGNRSFSYTDAVTRRGSDAVPRRKSNADG